MMQPGLQLEFKFTSNAETNESHSFLVPGRCMVLGKSFCWEGWVTHARFGKAASRRGSLTFEFQFQKKWAEKLSLADCWVLQSLMPGTPNYLNRHTSGDPFLMFKLEHKTGYLVRFRLPVNEDLGFFMDFPRQEGFWGRLLLALWICLWWETKITAL